MPTLTPDQLQEIRDIIRRHHSAIIARVVGVEALSEQERITLQNAGLLQVGSSTIEEAYLMGQAMGLLETPEAAKMGLGEFRDYVRKNPIPLSSRERAAVGVAQRQAAEHVRNLAERVIETTGRTVSEHEQRADIREAVATAIGQRTSAAQLASELGNRSEDWSRDWKRVAATELQTARLEGMADKFRERHGEDAWVFKRPSPGACRHCLRLHIGPDGNPRIFRLGSLEANNVGRKKADWQAVRGSTHPFCTCELGRVPSGWGFDEDGRLVPGGPGGVRYDDEGELERAVQYEDELQKGFRIRARVPFAGMTIAIENPAGTVRRWTDRMGNEGTTDMKWAYGYVEGTRGSDGDEYDVFVGPDPQAPFVWVIHQNREDSNEWDEDKAMLGFREAHQAIEAYLEHYDDPSFLGSVSMVPIEEFKAKVFATTEPAQDGMVKSEQLMDSDFIFEIPVDVKAEPIPEPRDLGQVEDGFRKALAQHQVHSSYGDRAIHSGSTGMNVAWGNPLTKPPFQVDHPGLDFDKKALLSERKEANDQRREQLLLEPGQLQHFWGEQGEGSASVHPFRAQPDLRIEANESARDDAELNRARIEQRNRERVGGTVENSQSMRKSGPLEVGEEITANKAGLGEVILRREAEAGFRVIYPNGATPMEELCKSMTAAAEHIWAVQQGYDSAADYREQSGVRRVPAGAGLRFWGLHKPKERRALEMPAVQ
jgi:hypothetical protein